MNVNACNYISVTIPASFDTISTKISQFCNFDRSSALLNVRCCVFSFRSVICGTAVSFFWNVYFSRWEHVCRDHLSKDVYISSCLTLTSLNFCGNAIFKQEVKNFIWQFYSVVLQDFSVSKWLACFQKWVENFSSHFLRQKHAWKLRMKNYIFLWCRYRVKNWLKTLCTLKCKSTRLSNDNEFMPSNLPAFLWRTSTLFVMSSLTTQIGYEFCWKKIIIDRNYARTYIEKHTTLSN